MWCVCVVCVWERKGGVKVFFIGILLVLFVGVDCRMCVWSTYIKGEFNIMFI